MGFDYSYILWPKETFPHFPSIFHMKSLTNSNNSETPQLLDSMASSRTPKFMKNKIQSSQQQKISVFSEIDADDDFQDPSPSVLLGSKISFSQQRLKPSNGSSHRPTKKLKKQHSLISYGKGNGYESQNLQGPLPVEEEFGNREQFEFNLSGGGLDALELSIDREANEKLVSSGLERVSNEDFSLKESILVECGGNNKEEEFEECTKLDLLLKLCETEERVEANEISQDCAGDHNVYQDFNTFYKQEELETENEKDIGLIFCPICGKDISGLHDSPRQIHINECLDKEETKKHVHLPHDGTVNECPGQVFDNSPSQSPRKVADVSPVLEWLRNLGLAKYEEIFVREEIDWDALKWLTEEDLCRIGITALGPRKKIISALNEIKSESRATDQPDELKTTAAATNKLGINKLITDYFLGSIVKRSHSCVAFESKKDIKKNNSGSVHRILQKKKHTGSSKQKDTPVWCCIPGTPFRVDAFKYLTRDCSHWFLTHFHMDHYQGLTRSFCHGKILCSKVTAKLVNMKLGISWDKLQVLPLNKKINIAGIDVTCFDANHCPGAIIILFELPNSKAVLHTGDFRFSQEMAKNSVLQTCPIHTLILDTTYCDPQYDFPKQEAVIQFVIEAIQAENFNPSTLFLIGSYTIGKERLFMEVARVLSKKIYVGAAKLRLLECMEYTKEEMQWLTVNEQESHIHVVPMWTIASFKRLKHIANQYAGRFNLVVAFSPTGWSFAKGKKKSPGRRWQQGTIIRYEVPYSEHSSYVELRDFVKFISPATIIPSVNNHGAESANTMVSNLLA